MARYSETRSVHETRNDAPMVVKTMINGYSARIGLTEAPVLPDDAQGRRIRPPMVKMNSSIAIETVLT